MDAARRHQLTIQTPEAVVFALPLAGPLVRFLAWLLDVGCICVLTDIAGRLLRILIAVSADAAGALRIIIFFAISIGYGMALEWAWQGQTVGKRIFGLRVMDLRGLRLQFSQVVIRNLLRAVDSLPAFYFLGGLVCLITRNAQRLGDLAANTIVVKQRAVAEPDLDELLQAGRYNSLRAFPHLAARMRQRVSPDEAALALQAVMRRDEFDPMARVSLFAEMAAHFKGKVAFPEVAVAGVSDEQYVRNIVDVVFRTRPDGSRDKRSG
jgi:uncharacterized RDD family membrane protein YckC